MLALVQAPATWAGVVAFSSDRCPEAYVEGCTKSLWTVADDGSDLTRVTPPAHLAPPGEASFDDEPSWSPDGHFLLYRRALHSRAGHGLWIASPVGPSPFQVGPEAPNDRFQSYDGPEWSPDGRWVVFGGRPVDAPRTEDGNGWSAIWSMSIDGAEIKRLTVGSEADVDPPVVLPIDSRASGGAAAWSASPRRRLSVRRRTLRFLAVDSGGVRRVEVAIARKARARGAARPVWRRVRGRAHFARMVRRLRPGRYRLRMRAVDAFGNRTRRPRVVHVRLRR